MLKLNRARASLYRVRVRTVFHHGLEIQHLEDTLEAHERGHHVNADVAQGCERAIETSQKGRKRQQGPDRNDSRDGQIAADAIHECGGQCGHQRQSGEENPVGHRDSHADIANTTCPG